MIFYILIHLFIYVFNILALRYLCKLSFKTKITRNTLPHVVYSILKFSKLKNLYCALVIAVVGIPVFICLYLLFNIYVVPLRNIDLLVLYMLFILFLMYIIRMATPIYLKTLNFSSRRAVKKKSLLIKFLLLSVFYFDYTIMCYHSIKYVM